MDTAIANVSSLREDPNTPVGLRLSWASITWRMFLENPLIGVGAGDFPSRFLAINAQFSPTVIPTWNPHNHFLFTLSTLGIAGGVALILLSVVALVTVAILEVGGEFAVMLMVVGLLLAIGLAVGLFISAGSKMETYDKLLNEGDYTKQHKAGNSFAEKISGPYWMLVVTIYLTWSFIRAAWGISWIVFPIAGVLFGLIAAISASFGKQ